MERGKDKRRATYQDVLDTPEHEVAEIVDGTLHVFPRPGNPASLASAVLAFKLGSAFHLGEGGPGGWIIVVEPELHFGEDIVVPDLAGWRRERLSVVPDAAFITTPPDWICEVLSKSTEKFDRAEKMPLFAREGVQHAWLVHPRRRTLEVYRLQSGHWLAVAVLTDDDKARIEPFEAIELDLAKLWADAPLPTRAAESPSHYDYEGP